MTSLIGTQDLNRRYKTGDQFFKWERTFIVAPRLGALAVNYLLQLTVFFTVPKHHTFDSIIWTDSIESSMMTHHSNESFVFVDSPKMIHQVPEQNLLHPNRKIKLAFRIEKIYSGIQMRDLRSLNQDLLDQDGPDEKGCPQRKIRFHFTLHAIYLFIFKGSTSFKKWNVLLCPSISNTLNPVDYDGPIRYSQIDRFH